MSNSLLWSIFYTAPPDQTSELDPYIDRDDLESILSSDSLNTELQMNNSKLLKYLAKPDTIRRLLAIMYTSTSQSNRTAACGSKVDAAASQHDYHIIQMSRAASDIFVADITLLLDNLAANHSLLEATFSVLEQGDDSMDDPEDASIEEDRSGTFPTPLNSHAADGFCRLVLFLVRSPLRLQRAQRYIQTHIDVIPRFVSHMQSAPVTEALFNLLLGKDRSEEALKLQQQLILDSSLITHMGGLFSQNAPYDALVHVSYIVCNMLGGGGGCGPEVRAQLLQLLPGLMVDAFQPDTHPGRVRTVMQMAVAAFSELVGAAVVGSGAAGDQTILEAMLDTLDTVPGILCAPSPSPSCPTSLLKLHAVSFLAELLRLSEQAKDAVADQRRRATRPRSLFGPQEPEPVTIRDTLSEGGGYTPVSAARIAAAVVERGLGWMAIREMFSLPSHSNLHHGCLVIFSHLLEYREYAADLSLDLIRPDLLSAARAHIEEVNRSGELASYSRHSSLTAHLIHLLGQLPTAARGLEGEADLNQPWSALAQRLRDSEDFGVICDLLGMTRVE